MKIKKLVFLGCLSVCVSSSGWSTDSEGDEKKDLPQVSSSMPVPVLIAHDTDGESSDLEGQHKRRTTSPSSTKEKKKVPPKKVRNLSSGGRDDLEDPSDDGLPSIMPMARGLRPSPLRIDADEIGADPTVVPLSDLQAREALLKRLQEQDAKRWMLGEGFYATLASVCGISGEVLKGVATTFGGVALAVENDSDKDWLNYAVILCGTLGQSFIIWSEKSSSAAKQRRHDIKKLSGYQVQTARLKSALEQQSLPVTRLKMGMARPRFMGVNDMPQDASHAHGAFIPMEDATIIPMDPVAGQMLLDRLQQQDADRWLWGEAFYGWSSSILGTVGSALSGVSTALAGASLFTGDEQTKQWYSFGVVVSGAAGSLCSYLSTKAKSEEKKKRADLERMVGIDVSVLTQPTVATDNTGTI